MKLTINCRTYEVEYQPDGLLVNGVKYKTSVLRDNGNATVRVNGRPYKINMKDEKTVVVDGRPVEVAVSGKATVARPAPKPAATGKSAAGAAGAGGSEAGAVRALMPGTVLSVRVQTGQPVAAGDVLLVLEAMKMQNDIKAPCEGTVKRIAVAAGQTVANGDIMVVIG